MLHLVSSIRFHGVALGVGCGCWARTAESLSHRRQVRAACCFLSSLILHRHKFLILVWVDCYQSARRTRTNTNPNGAEANAAGRTGNARALRKQSKCGMIQEGEGHWPNSSENLQKARNLWVLRTPQNNKEEGARAKKLVTCGTRGPLGRGQRVPFSAQGAYCSAPEP